MAAPQENLGSGGYGFVISPALQNNIAGVATNFPENVTKVFYDKNGYNSAVAKIPTISAAMGPNTGHRMNRYTRPYTASILKSSIKNTYGLANEYGLTNTDPLYLLRMPNLGKDFSKVETYVDDVRRVPMNIIFEQITKLLTQLNNLATAGYVHGDIRETNIMFKPDTGVMTIIDFDWLYPINDFDTEYRDNYGFYSNPPESIVFGSPFFISSRTRHWSDNHYKSFEHYYKSLGIKDKTQFLSQVEKVTIDNATYINSLYPGDRKKAAINIMLPKFDGFGLATTLLEFLTIVYTPRIVADELSSASIGRLRSALTSIGVTKNGAAYTSKELNAYSKALLSTVNAVLRPLARGRVSERIIPAEGLRRMGIVNTELARDLVAPGPTPAAAGSGAARRTRRSRRDAAKSRRMPRW
jgi:serine/threonine protein kinase